MVFLITIFFTSQNGELCIGRRNEGDPCISDENTNTRTMGKTEILMIIEHRNIACDNSRTFLDASQSLLTLFNRAFWSL